MQAAKKINDLISVWEFEEAIKVGLDFLPIDFKNPVLWNNIGVAAQNLRLYKLAFYAYQKAIDLHSDFWLCHLCQGLVLLLSGENYLFGFSLYEARHLYFGAHILIPSDREYTIWKGENLSGKTLLVHAEQGFGDTILFLRYVTYIKSHYNGNVVLFLQPEMNCIFKHLNVPLLNRGELCPYDVLVFTMGLPLCFKTELWSIPPPVEIDCRLNPVHGRIGIMWKTEYNNNDPNDLRSIKSSTKFEEIFKIKGFHFVCLQKAVSEEDAKWLDIYGIYRPVMESFSDTVKIIETCERVITIDTAVAHLAASMGVPTWILLNYTGCWRWLVGRSDSPWYPSARLFRQKKQHSWEEPIQQIAHELKELSCTLT